MCTEHIIKTTHVASKCHFYGTCHHLLEFPRGARIIWRTGKVITQHPNRLWGRCWCMSYAKRTKRTRATTSPLITVFLSSLMMASRGLVRFLWFAVFVTGNVTGWRFFIMQYKTQNVHVQLTLISRADFLNRLKTPFVVIRIYALSSLEY